jgi:hypothetical protein
MNTLLSLMVIVLIIMLLPFNTTFAQNAINSTNSIPPNAIRTPNGGWITPLQTHDANGTKLNIHYEVGTPVYGKVPPPVPNFITQYMLSPLKQLKSGIVAQNVKCRSDFMLITKAEDGSPACVYQTTVPKLVERGWTLETNNPKLSYMNIKVYSSEYPFTLVDHFLTGSLYSTTGQIQNGNITITVNGLTMGTTETFPSGCFQFNNWDDRKLADQINKSRSLGNTSIELNFQTQYFGDGNHNPVNASASSYLYLYAIPIPPEQYDTMIYPSSQINVTQGDSTQFHLTVKPFSKDWEVEHMKLNLQGTPCGLSYHISPVDNNDSVLVNNTASFDVVLNTTSYTPSGKYWISVDQDMSGINEPNIGGNVGAFDLNVVKK